MTPQRGFSFVELLFVIAIVATAAALAVPSLVRAVRISDLECARSEIASALKESSERAAIRGASESFSPGELSISTNVVLMPGSIALPDHTVPGSIITLEAGTGYPLVDGNRSAASVVIAEVGNEPNAMAIVISRSAMISEYRRVNNGWEKIQ